MERSEVEDLLDTVRSLFDTPPEQVETGLDIDDAGLLQLRKACRLLAAANHLATEKGYYTVVIEAGFAAIERTIQFYLVDTGLLQPEEYINHRMVYEQGGKAGLYNKELQEKLVTLWKDNRSQSYYRSGVGSRKRAENMLALAETMHNHITQLAGKTHTCLCGKEGTEQ